MPVVLTREQVAHINAMFARESKAEEIVLVTSGNYVKANLTWQEDDIIKNSDGELL